MTVNVVIAGIVAIAVLCIVCVAAYMIRAESFEFTTVFLRVISFSIKIVSPNARERANNPDEWNPGPPP